MTATAAAFGATYRTILGALVTRARLAALGALGAGAVLVGVAIGAAGPADADEAAVQLVNGVGLSVLVPVVALVFASAALGDLLDDQTLVYLWLRPVPRAVLALSAFAAALTLAAPLTLVPVVAGAALTGAGPAVVAGAAAAASAAVVVYTALFTALGLRVQRALAWGLAYILIWEGFVAQAGRGASRVAMRAYTRSILSELSDVPLALANASLPVAVIVPLATTAGALVYLTWRLGRHDVP